MHVDGLRKQDGNMQNEKKSREIKPDSVNALEIITKVSKENEILKRHCRLLKASHNVLLVTVMEFINKVGTLMEQERQIAAETEKQLLGATAKELPDDRQ